MKKLIKSSRKPVQNYGYGYPMPQKAIIDAHGRLLDFAFSFMEMQ
jgi:hypothetical protein